MAAYCCSECGGNHLIEARTNTVSYTGYFVTSENELEVDSESEEETPETKVHWECGDCGLILPCETFGELRAYMEGRL